MHRHDRVAVDQRQVDLLHPALGERVPIRRVGEGLSAVSHHAHAVHGADRFGHELLAAVVKEGLEGVEVALRERALHLGAALLCFALSLLSKAWAISRRLAAGFTGPPRTAG